MDKAQENKIIGDGGVNYIVEKVKTEVETMDFIMNSFAKFGASDTEPDSVYHSLLADAVNGAEVNVPRTAREWELFCNMEHVEQVARAMASHAEHVVNLIQHHMQDIILLDEDRKQLVDYLRDYCWRATVIEEYAVQEPNHRHWRVTNYKIALRRLS